MGVTNPKKFPRKPHKYQFVQLKLRLQFFLHQEIFKRKNFDIVWGTTHPEFSQMHSQNQLF